MWHAQPDGVSEVLQPRTYKAAAPPYSRRHHGHAGRGIHRYHRRTWVNSLERNPGALWDPGGGAAATAAATAVAATAGAAPGRARPARPVPARPPLPPPASLPYRVVSSGGGGGGGAGDRAVVFVSPAARLSAAASPAACNQTELLFGSMANMTLWGGVGGGGGAGAGAGAGMENCSAFALHDGNATARPAIHHTHPSLGVLLTLFAAVTVLGNLLVIIAIARERYLRTVTNYFIVSLAIADTIIGALVMPFNIVLEMTNQMWYFGADWCDVWHSFDVLASTASILNLTVISLDRYWAITDPIAYPSKMSTGRAFILIALVWICSAAISFPAILWWRLVATTIAQPHGTGTTTGAIADEECAFTEDSGYLIFSSIISFYIPMSVILFAYYKIYVAAAEQTRSLKAGAKVMSTNGDGGQVMTLRMHRGGGGAAGARAGGGGGGGRQFAADHIHYSRAANSDSETDSPQHGQHCTGDPDDIRPSRMISRKWKHFALSRKLSKLAKEQKAAKTLGIVMGVFCFCWVPFFVTNVLYGICNLHCVPHAHIVFPIFTWLGYINSGMNPIIYACSMRDFRRAFTKILLCCCPRYNLMQSRTRRRNYNGSFTSSSPMVSCGERCSNMVL